MVITNFLLDDEAVANLLTPEQNELLENDYVEVKFLEADNIVTFKPDQRSGINLEFLEQEHEERYGRHGYDASYDELDNEHAERHNYHHD